MRTSVDIYCGCINTNSHARCTPKIVHPYNYNMRAHRVLVKLGKVSTFL